MISERLGIPQTKEVNFGTKSVVTDSIVNVGSTTLDAGVYQMQYSVTFAENSTGYRGIGINVTATPTDLSAHGYRFCERANAVNGDKSVINMVIVDVFTTPVTWYFHVQQNSGATLNCYPRVFITKLA